MRHLGSVLKCLVAVTCMGGCATLDEMAEQTAPGKTAIEVPASENVAYEGKYKADFPNGFPVGIGSGMCYLGPAKGGGQLFYMIGDRGPNADGPEYLAAGDGKSQPAKIFPSPEFNPRYGVLCYKDGKAVVQSTIVLNTEDGPISGRPLPQGYVGSTGEVALDDNMSILFYDENGMDPEGIDIDRKNGSLWICDEYGPFIANVDAKNGRILKRYMPGTDLPAVLSTRQPNRGFEGLAVSPSNKVYAMVQSICDTGPMSVKKSNAQFIRLVELDPETGKTRMFAYPHDVDAYKRSKDAKTGDMCALSDTQFLVVEQGKGKDGKMRNLVYRIDISKATDISKMKSADGNELEEVATREELESFGIDLIQKDQLLDLREMGWMPEKAEGIAVLPDGKTIAISADNDFGLSSKVANPVMDKDGKPVKDAGDYVLKADGTMMYEGKTVSAEVQILPNTEEASFWVVRFDEPLLKK